MLILLVPGAHLEQQRPRLQDRREVSCGRSGRMEAQEDRGQRGLCA